MKGTTVLTVVSSKGGVGKTTCTRMLAAVLRDTGYNVLMVDLVGLATLTKSLGAEPSEDGSYRLLTDPRCAAADVVHTTAGGEHVIRGSAALDHVAVDLQRAYRPEDTGIILNAKLAALDGYDFIIIDTPTAVNAVHMNALIAASWVIVAADPDEGSAEALLQLKQAFGEAKQANPSLRVAGVLLSFADARTSLTQVMRERLQAIARKAFAADVFEATVRSTVKMGEARLMKQNPIDYAPRCSAVQDYRKLTAEVLRITGAPQLRKQSKKTRKVN